MWVPAIKEEFQTLSENGTGEEVCFEEIPPNATIYPSKMVLKKKRNSERTFTKAKGRLCAAACVKRFGKLLSSVFAPTVNEKSLKLLFIIAILFGLLLTGLDVKGAFLYPELDDPVYISLPRSLTGNRTVYWRLNKTLYGLPQSPLAFYDDVSKLLLNHGYSRTIADPCTWFKREGNEFMMFVVHVDDFAIAASSKSLSDELITVMKSRYTITVDDHVVILLRFV